MANPREGEGAAVATPNDIFRRVRRLYIRCIVLALPLLILAFYLTVKHAVPIYVTGIMMFGGVGLLIFALMARSTASCPRCMTPLMWKKGPIGTGRISIAEKSHCPECGLDLNVPWNPEDSGGAGANGDGRSAGPA